KKKIEKKVMKNFVVLFTGVIGFAVLCTTAALGLAVLTKAYLLPLVEGRYLLLASIYLTALLVNWVFIRKFKLLAKNMVVFGAVFLVGFVFFVELVVFARSSSIYQLYYSVGLVPLMYVWANFQLNRQAKSELHPV
ncbi:MAG: hypothetical protein OQJ89_04925, partial [Kangiellaceae bacterium]|nr:hypothetical protein [Kangiellaceae bacterium]